MIRLRDLSAPAVALEWHEAVAVVAALTATLWNERAAQAPTLEAAVLTPDGDVAIAGDGRLAGAVTSGLALALGALLESTPCPAELRHIVSANVGPAPELDSVNAFARALMFFERPGRVDVLRDLGGASGPGARACARSGRARAAHRARPAPRAAASGVTGRDGASGGGKLRASSRRAGRGRRDRLHRGGPGGRDPADAVDPARARTRGEGRTSRRRGGGSDEQSRSDTGRSICGDAGGWGHRGPGNRRD